MKNNNRRQGVFLLLNLVGGRKVNHKEAFTLMEILIVMGILAILAGIVLVAINPAHQFAQARDSQRLSNINALLNAVGQNIVENRGVFECNGEEVDLPSDEEDPEFIKNDGVDLYDCLVPKYLAEILVDPLEGNLNAPPEDYDTAYTIYRNISGRITLEAPYAELPENQPMSVTR